MPRRKLSEFRAKTIVNALLDQPYEGWPVTPNDILPSSFGKTSRFVVKVDQAIKQRFKKGLVFLDVTKADLQKRVNDIKKQGYTYVLVEPFRQHESGEERYLSFRREREGVIFSYSKNGGVEIESHADQIQSGLFESFKIERLAKDTGFSVDNLLALRRAFDELYITLLEINPYVIEGNRVVILDVAIEIDSAAELMVDAWHEDDVRSSATKLTDEELEVLHLAKESPASFSLEVINPDGAIFLLLSGGGASIVIADEIYTLGFGDQLANYGEYSGNPTEDETYRYATQVVKLLLRSTAPKKVAFIGGATANFTDIANTFSGIISVLNEHAQALRKQKVTFFVRRGGPRQEQGLRAIEATLRELGLYGGVYDPSTTIPEAVESLVGGLR